MKSGANEIEFLSLTESKWSGAIMWIVELQKTGEIFFLQI